MSGHSSAFNAAKSALGEFASTLTEEQRLTLNKLVSAFVAQSVRDYKAKRDSEEKALKAARDAMDGIHSGLTDTQRMMREMMRGSIL
jgi:hypothetical protein